MSQSWLLSEWKQKETNSLYFMLGHFYSSWCNYTIITNSLLEVYPSEMGSTCDSQRYHSIMTTLQQIKEIKTGFWNLRRSSSKEAIGKLRKKNEFRNYLPAVTAVENISAMTNLTRSRGWVVNGRRGNIWGLTPLTEQVGWFT